MGQIIISRQKSSIDAKLSDAQSSKKSGVSIPSSVGYVCAEDVLGRVDPLYDSDNVRAETLSRYNLVTGHYRGF